MSETVEDLLDNHSPQEVAPFTNFIPAGLGSKESIEHRLSVSIHHYQRNLAALVDLLEDEVPISITSLSVQMDAWNDYYEASLEMMRMTIAEHNSQRRAANKKITG